ncbi:MAG: hypothetical protein JWP69_1789 [Flaviaesturariibacter sp.]|nr:hypothetical protein [Flaviaesturariibacter sp.]
MTTSYKNLGLASILLLFSCSAPNKPKNNNDPILADTFHSISEVPITKNIKFDSTVVKAFDKIYFGKTSPYLQAGENYEHFLWQYKTTLAGIPFYYYSAKLDNYDRDYGLYGFTLASTEIYTQNENKEIIEEIKSIISLNYQAPKKIFISDEEDMKAFKSVDSMMNAIKKRSGSGESLKSGYSVFEYIWLKNNISIKLGYHEEYAWVDGYGQKLELKVGQNNRLLIKGQKKFYRPLLEFEHKEIRSRILKNNEKNEAMSKKNQEKLKSETLTKESSKF